MVLVHANRDEMILKEGKDAGAAPWDGSPTGRSPSPREPRWAGMWNNEGECNAATFRLHA